MDMDQSTKDPINWIAKLRQAGYLSLKEISNIVAPGMNEGLNRKKALNSLIQPGNSDLVLLEALASKPFMFSVIMCKGEVIVKHRDAMIVFRQNKELQYDADVYVKDKFHRTTHGISICPDNIRELILSAINSKI